MGDRGKATFCILLSDEQGASARIKLGDHDLQESLQLVMSVAVGLREN